MLALRSLIPAGCCIFTLSLVLSTACEATDGPPSVEVREADAEPPVKLREAAGPPSGLIKLPPAERRLDGVVEEVLDAGSYHYLALRADEAPVRWVVVANGSPRTGELVELEGYGVRRSFHSRRLNRDFKDLLFAALIEPPRKEMK